MSDAAILAARSFIRAPRLSPNACRPAIGHLSLSGHFQTFDEAAQIVDNRYDVAKS
jgi:hypothetical protein